MEAQLEAFERDMYLHPEFRMRNNLTGELLGRGGLNQSLAIQVENYLVSLLGPDYGLEVHIQKAWQVVCDSEWDDRVTHPP